MCEWCDKDEIKELIHYGNDHEDYSVLKDVDDGVNCIVYDEYQYHLWVACEDSYYDGIKFRNIQFCPYCGRKLK